MSYPTECPSCQADLTGPPIPEEHQSSYGNHTHFSRCIGVYDLDRDRVVLWECPDCGFQWER